MFISTYISKCYGQLILISLLNFNEVVLWTIKPMQPKDKVSLEMVDLHLHFILHLDFNLEVEGAVVKRYIVCCCYHFNWSMVEWIPTLSLKILLVQLKICMQGTFYYKTTSYTWKIMRNSNWYCKWKTFLFYQRSNSM